MVAAAAGVILAAGAVLWRAGAGTQKMHSIAVMPLARLDQDRAAAGLGETLTGELTGALESSNRWKVAGRAPSLDLGGRNPMLAQLRQSVRAEAVLTGSYRVEEPGDLRVDLQLINAADGYLLWTGSYHRPPAESHGGLARTAIAELTQKYTGRISPRTRYYGEAREAWSTYTEPGLEESLKLFQQAIAAEPGYAPAWAGLADANARLAALATQPVHTRLTDARSAASRAIQLDDSNAEAHALLGKILVYEDWNFADGVRQLERAVALDPVRVPPMVWYSEVLTILGDMPHAEKAIEAARSRLPRVPDLVFQQGCVFFLARKWEGVEAAGRELIPLEPARSRGHWLLGISLEQRGRLSEAIAAFTAGVQKGTDDVLRNLCALSHTYGLAGDRAHAIDVLDRLYRTIPEDRLKRMSSCCTALAYIGLKQTDGAFEALSRARDTKDPSFPFFPYDIRYDALKGDPRYARLADSLRSDATR